MNIRMASARNTYFVVLLAAIALATPSIDDRSTATATAGNLSAFRSLDHTDVQSYDDRAPLLMDPELAKYTNAGDGIQNEPLQEEEPLEALRLFLDSVPSLSPVPGAFIGALMDVVFPRDEQGNPLDDIWLRVQNQHLSEVRTAVGIDEYNKAMTLVNSDVERVHEEVESYYRSVSNFDFDEYDLHTEAGSILERARSRVRTLVIRVSTVLNDGGNLVALLWPTTIMHLTLLTENYYFGEKLYLGARESDLRTPLEDHIEFYTDSLAEQLDRWEDWRRSFLETTFASSVECIPCPGETDGCSCLLPPSTSASVIDTLLKDDTCGCGAFVCVDCENSDGYKVIWSGSTDDVEDPIEDPIAEADRQLILEGDRLSRNFRAQLAAENELYVFDPTLLPTLLPTPLPTAAPRGPGACPTLEFPRARNLSSLESCTEPLVGSVCALACDDRAAYVGGSRVYQCQEGGEWYPSPRTAGIQCLAPCPKLPLDANVVSSCDGAWPGVSCELTCAAGAAESTTQSTPARSLFCDDSSVWRSQTTQDVVPFDNNGTDILQCVQPVCVTTIDYVIDGFQCDPWDENVTEYVMNVPFEIGRNISVSTPDGDRHMVQITPGENTVGVFTSSTNVDYSFIVRMAEPSPHSHLTELYIYPHTAENEFDITTSAYSFQLQLPLWADILVIEPIPAQFATVAMRLQLDGKGNHIALVGDMDMNLTGQLQRRNLVTVNITGELMTVLITVTAQDGSQSEYELQLGQESVTTCDEQRFCEGHLDRVDCGETCVETTLLANWQALAVIGGLCGVGYVVMIALMKYTFTDASLFNTSVFTLFSSVFDVGNDVIFIALLFDENRTVLVAVAASLLASTILFNGIVCAYVTSRERTTNNQFAKWHQQALAYASFVSFLSLANCDAFAIVVAGRKLDVKRREGSKAESGVSKWFRAPASASFERRLKLASWWGLVCDDMAFIAIQVYLLFTNDGDVNTDGGTDLLPILLAFNVLVLVLRVTLLACRSMTITVNWQSASKLLHLGASTPAVVNNQSSKSGIELPWTHPSATLQKRTTFEMPSEQEVFAASGEQRHIDAEASQLDRDDQSTAVTMRANNLRGFDPTQAKDIKLPHDHERKAMDAKQLDVSRHSPKQTKSRKYADLAGRGVLDIPRHQYADPSIHQTRNGSVQRPNVPIPEKPRSLQPGGDAVFEHLVDVFARASAVARDREASPPKRASQEAPPRSRSG